MVPKKKVHKLSFDYENDFLLVGIASHENDYRISWALNKQLGWKLIKGNDFKINHPKLKVQANYSMYHYLNDNDLYSYHLISNKSERGFLLPDLKNIDYILKISGEVNADVVDAIVQKIKKIDIIITAFTLEEISDRLHKMFVF
ncbi:MAG: IPExxxVDY family protein [Thiohalospira sp.]